MFRCILAAIALALVGTLHAAPLNGTYTVGGISPHFETLPLAIQALRDEGVDGPVVLNIRPGSYNTNWGIPDIVGASETNTITIQSETGRAEDVEFWYTSIDPASSSLSVAQISGDWITLQYITLRQETNFWSVYGRVLEVTGDVNHTTIRHCRLIGTTKTTTIHDRFAVLFNWKTSTYAADDILIEHNEILNGSVGIYWGGSSLNQGSGLRIRHNTIQNWGIRGMQVLTEPDVEITDNRITAETTYSSYPYGMLLEDCPGSVRIERNVVRSPQYTGIGIFDAFGDPLDRALVANNMVHVGYPSTAGISLHESDDWDIVHNSIWTEGHFASSVALNLYYGNDTRVLNNILQDLGIGASMRATFPASNPSLCNGNLFYSPNGAVGGAATLLSSTFTTHTLADWQTLFGHDAASLVDSARFASGEDLHLLPGSPGIGAALAGWAADDIDGAARSASPDMGADEQGAESCAFSVAVLDAQCPPTSAGPSGAIDLERLSGTGPFSFLWSDGATTEDRSGLAAGSYVVSASNGMCTWTDTIAVGCLPPVPPFSFAVEGTGASCFGECDARVDVLPLGGCPPYQFWIRRPGTGWNPISAHEDGLCPGPAIVAVRDDCGTVDTQYVLLPEPARLKPALVFRENVSCKGLADASLEVAAVGGTPPYQWSKNGGLSYQSSGYFDGLPAGVYAMRLEDANGCDRSGNLTITEPDDLVLGLVSVVDESAPGAGDGQLTAAASGGSGDKEFRLDGGGWQSSPVFGGLSAGSYLLEVTDENDCMDALTVLVGSALRSASPEAGWTLWPNPAVASVVLSAPEVHGMEQVALVAADGRVLRRWNLDGMRTQSLGLEGLAAGMYRLHLQGAFGSFSLPLQIQAP